MKNAVSPKWGRRKVQRRLPVRARSVDGGTARQQFLHHCEVAVLRCQGQSGLPRVIRIVQVDVVLGQRPDLRKVAAHRGRQQRVVRERER